MSLAHISRFPFPRRGGPAARGFALVELAAVAAVAVAAAAILLIASSDSRRLARLNQDVAQLRSMGAAVQAYGADNSDLFPTFSWRAGESHSQYPELNNAGSDLQAAANQLVHILRTRGGRPDMPVMFALLPHFRYSHLILADYTGQPIPWIAAISSADTHRLRWARDPACFDQNCFGPYQPSPGTSTNKRWPYSSSFEPTLAFIDRSAAPSCVSNQQSYNIYLVPGAVLLGGAPMAQVRHPSQKVMLHDTNARHFGPRQPYSTHDEARLPLLMADGSVPVRAAANSNPGWQPNAPTSTVSLQFSYAPQNLWEPPPLNPGGDWVQGRFRYTRSGILGRDFGGPEVR